MIGFVTWTPFIIMMAQKSDQVKKPIIVVKICYKLLCISNFLASTDIKVFGHIYLFAMLLLIDLALFYTHGVFNSFMYIL